VALPERCPARVPSAGPGLRSGRTGLALYVKQLMLVSRGHRPGALTRRALE